MTKNCRPLILVLLSTGRHPRTGRRRLPELDARALEVGLRLTEANSSLQLQAIHAGTSDLDLLVPYLGMGIKEISVLETGRSGTHTGVLAEAIAQCSPVLTLCGDRAVDGFASGMLAFGLAHRLKMPVVSNAAMVSLAENGFLVRQALEYGARKDWLVRSPGIVTVGEAGPQSRQPAFAKMRSGKIHFKEVILPNELDRVRNDYTIETAAPIQKYISKVDPNASAEERLAAITSTTTGHTRLEQNLSASQIADYIIADIKKPLNDNGHFKG